MKNIETVFLSISLAFNSIFSYSFLMERSLFSYITPSAVHSDRKEVGELNNDFSRSKNKGSETPALASATSLLERTSEQIKNSRELVEDSTEETMNFSKKTKGMGTTIKDNQQSGSGTKNLTDDTVISIDPVLLSYLIGGNEVEAESMDSITIGELKKVKKISVATDGFGKIKSLEGLQYAENLREIRIAGKHDFNDLSPLKDLENLHFILFKGGKVADFRPLKKIADRISQGIPSENLGEDFIPGINIESIIDVRISRLGEIKNDPLETIGPVFVNPDGKTWDFEMPFYFYDGSRLETDGGDIQYTGSGRTARIGEDIENLFHIKLKKEVNNLSGSSNTVKGSIKIGVDYLSSLQQVDSPFLQKLILRGELTEIDRETLEQKRTDLGPIKDFYGHVSESITKANIQLEESKPVQPLFKGTFQRNTSEAVVPYIDKAIDDGLSYVQVNYHGIHDQQLKSSDLYIRAAGTEFTLPPVPELAGYSLVEGPAEKKIQMPAEGETLEITYIYGENLTIADKVLEQQLRSALNVEASQSLTDYAMLKLETFSYDASNGSSRIKDISGLQYAHNLQKLVLINQEIGSTLSDSVTQNLPNLTYLDLSKNQNSLVLGSLAYMNQLTNLWLNESEVEQLSPTELPASLEVLAMKKMKMASLDLSFLSSGYLNKLKRMDLSDNQGKITNESLVHIAQAAKNNPLEYVDLSGNQLSDLSALSVVEDLKYVPAGSQPDFTADRGWNFANQMLTADQRLTAGKEVRFENLVKNKKGEAYLPTTSDVDFWIENNMIIWNLAFNNDGSLAKEKAVFQYEGYQDTNYSATFTLALQYQPLKIEVPLFIQFRNNGNARTVSSPKYQLMNHSAFPVEVSLAKVEAGGNNPLPLVEVLSPDTEGISLFLKTDHQVINLAKAGDRLTEIAVGKAVPFSLEGQFFTTTTAEKKLDYTFQFTFKEKEDLMEKP